MRDVSKFFMGHRSSWSSNRGLTNPTDIRKKRKGN